MGNNINFAEIEPLINQLCEYNNKSNEDKKKTNGNKDILNENNEKLKSKIVKFVCYFNLFENYLYENNIDHWYEFFNKYTIDESLINEHFDFFYDRYIENNIVNDNFNSFSKYVKREYLEKLKNDLIKKQNKSKSVLSISYYFRNNLYHGHKAICELNRYEQCFEKITDFLLKVLKHAKEKNNG